MAGVPHLTLGSGDTISTPDVNVLDADTAHLQQGVGKWNGLTLSADLTPGFGDYVGGKTAPATGAVPHANASQTGTNGIPISSSTEYAVSLLAGYLATVSGEDYEIRLDVFQYDSGGSSLGSTILSGYASKAEGALHEITGTFTSHASAAYLAFYVYYRGETSNGRTIGDYYYVDKACVRTGADTTFQPSQDIQSTVDEDIEPAGCAVSYVKGTGTVIGTAWAGNFESYVKRDGTAGPIVLACYPEDVYG